MSTEDTQVESIHTTFRLPKPLHKRIRKEAADSDRSMTELIQEQLTLRYPDLTEKPQEQPQAA